MTKRAYHIVPFKISNKLTVLFVKWDLLPLPIRLTGSVLQANRRYILRVCFGTERNALRCCSFSFSSSRNLFFIARYRTKCKRLEREAEQGLQGQEPVVRIFINDNLF